MEPLSKMARYPSNDSPNPWRHPIQPTGTPLAAPYVLDKDIQDGKKIPKWDDRACIGIYLGPSPLHASSVALILNLTTGLMSPQFHYRADDTFDTIKSAFGKLSTLIYVAMPMSLPQ